MCEIGSRGLYSRAASRMYNKKKVYVKYKLLNVNGKKIFLGKRVLLRTQHALSAASSDRTTRSYAFQNGMNGVGRRETYKSKKISSRR